MKIRDAAGEIPNETKIDTAYPASSLSLSHDSFLPPCRGENPASPNEYRIVKRETLYWFELVYSNYMWLI